MRLPLLWEQPQPVAHHDGEEPQVELVHEVALEQPAQEVAAAMDLELAPGLRLELAHRRLDVAGDDVGVLPRRALERSRGHVLGQDVDAVRDRIALVVVRPVALPDLPGAASEQERIGALEVRGEEAPTLIVGVRGGPTAAVEPAAPVLIGASGAWYTPSKVTIIDAVSFMSSLLAARSEDKTSHPPETHR